MKSTPEPPTAAMPPALSPSPREFALSRISMLFTPRLSSLQHSRAIAGSWPGPGVSNWKCRDDCVLGSRPGREERTGRLRSFLLSACAHQRPPRTRHLTQKGRLHSLEMQKYLFWFPSLFLEILFWFIKHRNSQHLKQTFKTPM